MMEKMRGEGIQMQAIIQAVVLRIEDHSAQTFALYSQQHGKIIARDVRTPHRLAIALRPGFAFEGMISSAGREWKIHSVESVICEKESLTPESLLWRAHVLDLFATYLFSYDACQDLFALLTFTVRIQKAPDVVWRSVVSMFFYLQGHPMPEDFLWVRDVLQSYYAQSLAGESEVLALANTGEEENYIEHKAWLKSAVFEHERSQLLRTQGVMQDLY
jgi:hypothetical protein